MQNLRIYAPAGRSEAVVNLLRSNPGVSSLAIMPGASLEPAGDLILADVAREAANGVLEELRALNIHREGSIHMTPVPTWLSQSALDAELAYPGASADAVVWADVVQRSYEDSALTWSYLSLLTAAVVIAEVAIILDSPILVVGAMVVGPEFGAVAAISLALIARRKNLLLQALKALAVGFGIAIGVGILVGRAFLAAGWATAADLTENRPLTQFIYEPDKWSAFIAIVAGIVGVMAITSQRSGALVGVFISVTTVPAAGNIALAIAMHVPGEVIPSVYQLLINLTCMAVAGSLTLLGQGAVWRYVVEPRRRKKKVKEFPQAFNDPDRP